MRVRPLTPQRMAILDLLLYAGANPNAGHVQSNGMMSNTPLSIIIDGGVKPVDWDEHEWLNVIKKLLKYGANPNRSYIQGALSNKPEKCTLLVDFTNYRHYPLQTGFVDLLCYYGANPNKFVNGATALDHALHNLFQDVRFNKGKWHINRAEHVVIIKKLIEVGAHKVSRRVFVRESRSLITPEFVKDLFKDRAKMLVNIDEHKKREFYEKQELQSVFTRTGPIASYTSAIPQKLANEILNIFVMDEASTLSVANELLKEEKLTRSMRFVMS